MMPATFLLPSLALSVDAPAEEAILLAKKCLRRLGAPVASATFRIYRRSVDARKREDVRFVYSVAFCGDFSVRERERLLAGGCQPLRDAAPDLTPTGTEGLPARPVVVGSGPAGLFAALTLAEAGYRPLLLERGGDLRERAAAVARFTETRQLDTDTNIQFGAGGAGTFSDGKLVTRVNDPAAAFVLRRLVEFGAPPEICMLAKPHIGTDRLVPVVAAMLDAITAAGGELRFHARVTDLSLTSGGQVSAVHTADGAHHPCGALVLAIGHSARDTYEMLLGHGLAIEPKPFSVGLRIEHLQSDIDRALYGDFAGHPALGHAEYALSDRLGSRGVYTFCMCPGGEVVAAASEAVGTVVNGMSRHARDGRNANAAVLASVECADYGNTPYGAIAYQRRIEQAAYAAGGSDYSAPVCLLGDFLSGREGSAPSRILPSYMGGGVTLASPDRYLPTEITAALREALPRMGRRIEGFCAPDVPLTGPETRTSAPLRILRHPEARTALGHANLYPCGEGAGYAGGITSAALDGLYTACAILSRYRLPTLYVPNPQGEAMNLRQENKCEKKWILHDMTDDAARRAAEEISSALGVSRVLAGLLVARGYRTPDAARAFIGMESELLHNPFLMQDMERAVNRIRRAIRRHEKITIYGDYDVDGVTSVCTLYLYLRRRGADVDYYIPNRIGEGYGVSMNAVRTLAEGGTRLILTVDTGVTAHAEVEYAKTLGVDFVITDHHECHETLPAAAAVVNPHRPDCPYPFKELAGVGVVFKLICAYEESETGDRRAVCVRRMCEEYSDLVAIGTIADVMPICDENRLIVAFGLQQIESSRRPGLLALIEAAQARPDGREARAPKKTPKITSGYIGYTLAPRINAAGRVRSATRAVELFLSTDRAVAASLAAELCEANRDRQNEENRITEEAYRQIEENPALAENPVIVLSADDWHHGVIGIVSSRITERYGLPSILVSFEGEGNGDTATASDIGKGSGRSVKGMNLAEALYACRDTLVKFGGHELAAGLSVRRGDLPAFYEKINEYAKTHLSPEALIPTLEADCTLAFSDLTMELAEELRMLEPYGVGNPSPTFVLRGARVIEATPVSGGKHTRFVLGNGERCLTAMCFSRSLAQLDLFVGDTVDLLFSLDINEYNGRRTVQLIVRDIRRPDEVRAQRAAARRRFDEIMGGATFTADEDVVPERADFAAVYTAISRCVRGGMDTLSLRALGARLPEISYLKLKVIIRIFEELHLLGIEETGEETYRFSIQFTGKKTDLEKSTWLHRLRSQRR